MIEWPAGPGQQPLPRTWLPHRGPASCSLRRGAHWAHGSNNPFSIEAQTEMMGRLAEGTGGSRATRKVMRVVGVIALIPFVVSIVLGILDLVR